MAYYKSVLFVLLTCLFCIINSTTLICTEAFCRNFISETGCPPAAVHCINNGTHTGMLMPSPTICNCCRYCLPFYLEGEHCSLGGPGAGTTIGRCADGLTCALDEGDGETRCTRMSSPCHTLQDQYDAREESGLVGALEPRPTCDGKGRHTPVHCVPAQTCFCQSEEGERIFGESLNLGINTLRHMTCACSRLHEKINNYIKPGVSLPVVSPRCTEDGNFNPIQCLDRICYCVDPATGIIHGDMDSINLDYQNITRLACYNPNLDLFPQYNEGRVNFTYTTPCLEDILDKVTLKMESEEQGYNVDFASEDPECYPDGTFGRIAYTPTGSKICINNRGMQIGDYEVSGLDEGYDTMDCKCAVTSYLMGESAEKPVCCKNGNFRRIQCRRGLCRCVDSDGRQTQKETANVSDLRSCYTENWMDC